MGCSTRLGDGVRGLGTSLSCSSSSTFGVGLAAVGLGGFDVVGFAVAAFDAVGAFDAVVAFDDVAACDDAVAFDDVAACDDAAAFDAGDSTLALLGLGWSSLVFRRLLSSTTMHSS